MPPSCKSKHPTSSVAPNRFFIDLTKRNRECRSPSKLSTTSTKCSNNLGPAIDPSFVTWPTKITVIPRSLAILIAVLATSRTCVTPPGEPSTAALAIVWIESIINKSGLTASMCATTALNSFSAASQRDG